MFFFLDRSAHVLSIFICRAFQWLLSWLLNVYLLLLSIFTCRTSHFLFAGLLNDRRVDDLVSDQQHVELPPAKVERLRELLASFPRQRKTCPKKDLLKLVGELCSMILALPGGIGCLSWLQERIKATACKSVKPAVP